MVDLAGAAAARVHLVTREISERLHLSGVRAGLLHLFLLHTSAALTVNENASPEVRSGFERGGARQLLATLLGDAGP